MPKPLEPAADAADYAAAVERVRQGAAEAQAHFPPERLPQWVVTESPADHPGMFVARLWVALPEPQMTNCLVRAATLAEVRDLLPPGLTCLARSPADDPVIVETWL